MNVTMTARHCEIDPELRLFAQNRIEKLGRYANDIQEVHLVVTAEKFRHAAEITVRLKGREIVGREEANDARAAVDQAADHLENQIRRVKERRIENHRRPRAVNGAEPNATPAEEDVVADIDSIDEE
jgi:putative sigma-54 modulation protein